MIIILPALLPKQTSEGFEVNPDESLEAAGSTQEYVRISIYKAVITCRAANAPLQNFMSRACVSQKDLADCRKNLTFFLLFDSNTNMLLAADQIGLKLNICAF